jgi:hypothetical protein
LLGHIVESTTWPTCASCQLVLATRPSPSAPGIILISTRADCIAREPQAGPPGASIRQQYRRTLNHLWREPRRSRASCCGFSGRIRPLCAEDGAQIDSLRRDSAGTRLALRQSPLVTYICMHRTFLIEAWSSGSTLCLSLGAKTRFDRWPSAHGSHLDSQCRRRTE